MSRVSTRGATRPEGGRIAGRLSGRTIDLCAGPGGMAMGACILGLPDMIGVELDAEACATAQAAGFDRRQHDMRLLAPVRHRGVTGAVITPPCPTWSAAGKGTGREDMQLALDAITCLGAGCGCEWTDLPTRVQDDRTALVIETARWVLTAPDLQWFVAEETPAVEPVWEDITAEAYAAGWEWVNVLTLDALDYGLPSRRRRTFVVGRRFAPSRVTEHDAGWKGADLPRRSMSQALGWEPGHRVYTRNNRKAGGGNAFNAEGPSWCLTGSTRTWALDGPLGRQLTIPEGSLLNGFPADYPWAGSRTKVFGQIADVVAPPMAAVVLGIATDTPWAEPVRAYLDGLYRRPAYALVA